MRSSRAYIPRKNKRHKITPKTEYISKSNTPRPRPIRWTRVGHNSTRIH